MTARSRPLRLVAADSGEENLPRAELLPRAVVVAQPSFRDNSSREVSDNSSREGEASTTTKLAAVLGIVPPFDAFACVLPGHAGCTAELHRPRPHGYFLYRCPSPWSGGLADVCASQRYGNVRTLSGIEAARWRERLEFDAGIRAPHNIVMKLPADASSAATRVAAGISLFLGLRDFGQWGTQPWTFTRRFAMAYCGVSEDIARRGTAELRKHGVIVLVDALALGATRRAYLWRLADATGHAAADGPTR